MPMSWFSPWNWFSDEWLTTRQAAKLFFVATLLVLAVTPQAFGWVNPLKMPMWERIPWSILSMLGVLALFFLWVGMWRYWARLDYSTLATKRIWFFILLFGFWYGSCLYYYCAYRPQVGEKWQVES